ncbi:argininosuccinate lyase [Nannocystis sp. ILAH1]|uniref:argininosuccinate lyase n=1 Tax=unclassified Nannocystis TaxID=2627009 RepID=UPI00226DABA4|nr:MULTISPECIES: argininosuccinate lyase [unclassified Nannocystis]MCY0990740.1 argininosuccinate lyase [Nannocystis sp. ILAH1]MCY1072272.1 argininosuccinate lyase [Nannocystis sp. RBIL2]
MDPADRSHENPWSGRFARGMSARLTAFNTSLPIEERLFECDVEGTKAHVSMLNAVGLLDDGEHRALQQALDEVLAEWRAGAIKLAPRLEDIHMNLEALLVDKVGQLGKKTHSARSRNDQQATAQRLYFRRSTRALIDAIHACQVELYAHCRRHADLIMPSYTHLQRAEFTHYAHWLATYVVMLERDRSRFEDALRRADECPLGACASTGTSLGIDRRLSARLLGFSRPTRSSIDAVSNRDYLLEFVNHAAILMITLSRLSEEIITFSSQEFGFLALDDALCTGSSIMPQKKNPDVLELVRGKSGVVVGNATSLLVICKSLPLGYNKDLQEDKTAWFSALDNCMSSLALIGDVVQTMTPSAERMTAATRSGHILATEYANYLVKKGLPFRDAHRLVGGLVKRAEADGVDVSELPLDVLRDASELFDEDIQAMSVREIAAKKNSVGSCGDAALPALLQELGELLDDYESRRGRDAG